MDYWPNLLIEIVQGSKGDAMRITSLVNAAVRNWHFAERSDREKKKIEILKLIGKLIQTGKFERIGRKYVNIPASDDKYRSWLTSFTQPNELSMPNV
jgi:hypothetical protein